MHSRTFVHGFTAALAAALTLAGGQAYAAAAGSGSGDELRAARVVTYDASASAEFRAAVDRGAAIWNESVDAVELRPATAGQRANIRILADNGWPRAQTTSLGNGTVYIGRQAVNQGYDTVRISAHELGHILGLPDRKPGPCSSLMSGSSAGVPCTNPYPNAAEKAQVEGNFDAALARPAAPAVPDAVIVG
ncbi:snapalysin family zinc-dependent metalloprotease [Streptomyces resistomycificus]|uniref:Extracellular small neutral protease n=1 Tax=Streptomyces resistomycificus TaxID=67356 RepID=A0A0L8LWK3_9ACTN|nr:snapalysin family zinc-dependent metalloprotease [Streptomyces resistomycificus]KOG42459.1 peptidase [Streptomyces resistomycificus]KUN92610.1 peptidase [Streptomyces resistomycificus]